MEEKMQVNIGEKIRELRKRDGRKQEDLANALGVTAQAVSRWEANGGYPDMNMIPAIANYFHVTIDSLFGYNNDREMRIKEYQVKASQLLMTDQDMSQCISLMREALNEFPGENKLLVLLAAALNKQGWRHKGEDPNPFWDEATTLYEQLLPHEQSSIVPLLSIYSQTGKVEKAVDLASKQPGINHCKEVLLANIADAKEGTRYRAEAVLNLLHELRVALGEAICWNDELKSSREALDILLTLRNLLEIIIDDEFTGYHSDLCFIDLECARIAGDLKEYDDVLKYFDKAFDQYIKYKEWHDMLINNTMPKDADFKSALLRNAKLGVIYELDSEFFEYPISDLPKKIKEQILKNQKYKTLFAKQ